MTFGTFKNEIDKHNSSHAHKPMKVIARARNGQNLIFDPDVLEVTPHYVALVIFEPETQIPDEIEYVIDQATPRVNAVDVNKIVGNIKK